MGYIRFNIWVVPQMEKLRRAVREHTDTPALVTTTIRSGGAWSARAARASAVSLGLRFVQTATTGSRLTPPTLGELTHL